MQFVSDQELLAMAAKRLRMHMGMPAEHADRFRPFPDLDYKLIAEFTGNTSESLRRKSGVLDAAIGEVTTVMASQKGVEVFLPAFGAERRQGLYNALKVDLG